MSPRCVTLEPGATCWGLGEKRCFLSAGFAPPQKIVCFPVLLSLGKPRRFPHNWSGSQRCFYWRRCVVVGYSSQSRLVELGVSTAIRMFEILFKPLFNKVRPYDAHLITNQTTTRLGLRLCTVVKKNSFIFDIRQKFGSSNLAFN